MILDHVEGFELSEEESSEHFDSVMALARLSQGLWWLYQDLVPFEEQVRIEAQKDNVECVIVGGILENIPLDRVSCAFQWYAVSACNYAQLVGWLATGNSDKAKKYVETVLPRLLTFRNKIAAHFALTAPRRDNQADLAASVLTQVIYVSGRLSAAALTPVVKVDGNDTSVTTDFSWSLTQAHRQLARRYWPDGPPQAFQSLRIRQGETVTYLVQMPHPDHEAT